jgi:hypothetical protein
MERRITVADAASKLFAPVISVFFNDPVRSLHGRERVPCDRPNRVARGDAAALTSVLKLRDRAPPAQTRRQERTLLIYRVSVEPLCLTVSRAIDAQTAICPRSMSSESTPFQGDADSRSSVASEVARRILARDALASEHETESATPETATLALRRSCARVTGALRNSMGDAGCAALLARALARTVGAHPVLKDLHGRADEGIRLDRIAASADAHGIDSVTAAIEALIGALVDILTRLVGDDMAIRLLDHDGPQPRARGGAREP